MVIICCSLAGIGQSTCRVWYVNPSGGGTGAAPGNYTTLTSALGSAVSGDQIQMLGGSYTFTSYISLVNGVSIEGSFEYSGGEWRKNSNNATSITFNTAEVVSAGGTDIRIARGFVGNSVSGFRLQDLTITVNASTTTAYNSRGVSIYGLYLNGCSNYNVVRCIINTGNASQGTQGSNGGAGGAGSAGASGTYPSSCTFNGTRGAATTGGSGGSACTASWSGSNGSTGYSGGAGGSGEDYYYYASAGSQGGGGGGAGGAVGAQDCGGTPNTGGAGSNGGGYSAGVRPATGANGTGGTASHTGGYFLPGIGTNGAGGAGGAGGGGGGGGGDACDSDYDEWPACGGASGGGGGGGGCGGQGSGGSGGTFSVYLWSNGSNGIFTDCQITPGTAPAGLSGGTGGTGGNGGAGGSRYASTCGTFSYGGAWGGYGGDGGRGQDGGNGGAGGKGSDGVRWALANQNGGTAPSFGGCTANSSATCGSTPPNPANPITAKTDGEGCTYSIISLTKGTGTWSGLSFINDLTSSSSSYTTASSPANVYFTSTGRQNIATTSGTYNQYVNIKTSRTQPAVSSITEICAGGTINPSISAGYNSGDAVSWELTTVASPSTVLQSSAAVNPSFVINTAGSYQVRLYITSPCCGKSVPAYATVNVVADPSPQSVSGTPTSGTEICLGGTVSASFSGGSGGTGTITDNYQYSTDGGGSWSSYTPGSSVTSVSTGSNRVQVRTWRTASGSGCDASGYSTSQWTVQPDPSPQSVTGSPVSGTDICIGGSVSASFSGGSGGAGTITNNYQYSTDGGSSWSSYTPGNSVTSVSTGSNRVQVRTWRTATGNGCDASSYNTALWTVVADPSPQSVTGSPSSGTDICLGGSVSATFSGGSGGAGTITDNYQYSNDGGGTWSSYTPGNSVTSVSTGSSRVQVRTWRTASGAGCNTSGYSSSLWTVVADPSIVTHPGSGSICPSSSSVLSVVGSGGTPSLTYQWQYNNGGSWANVSNGTPSGSSYSGETTSSLNVSGINTDGPYDYRCIVSASGTGCTSANSNSGRINVLLQNSWVGAGSTAWANSTNWCLSGSVPSSTTDIIIPDAALTANDPGISALSSCRNITIHSGGVLNISNAQLDVYGNWSNSGTANTTTAWIKFTGSSAQQMSASQPVNYLLVDNAAGLTLTGALTVNSGLSLLNGTLTNGANLTMANTSVITRYSGSIASPPTFAGLVDVNYMTSGNVTTGAELPSSASVLRNLGVQVGTGNVVTLNAAARLNGQLNLNTGVLRTSSTNLLTLSDGATVSGASNNSFVDGPVSKIGDDAFEFPTGDVVGSTFVWAPIAMADPGSSTSDRFTAEYTLQAAPYNWAAGDMCDVNDMNHVSGVEYWDIVRNTGSTYPDLTLYWKDASRSGIADVPNIVLGHREACGWKRMSGSASGTTGPGGTGSVTGSGFTSYSPITFGTKNMNNPLPVSLVEFSGTCSNNSVSLFWMTASETNNEFFTVERSRNATEWETAGTVDGAGNSNSPLNYRFIDHKAYDGYSYYRLKQSDFDGKSETFSPIVVSCEQGNPYEINVYPNPFKNELILRFANVSSDKANVMIYDLLGTNVMNREYVIGNGIDRIELDMSGIATGVYYIEFNAGDVRFRTKVVKN